MNLRKVVITGYGIKAPKIDNKKDFQEVLKQGICTHQILTGAGPDGSNVVVGLIEDTFENISGKNYKRYTRVSRLAMAAADDAIDMAGLRGEDSNRVAIIIGSSAGGMLEIEKYSPYSADYRKLPLHSVALANMHTLSSAVASHLGINGQVYTVSTGCTSSSDAILMGKLLIESGMVDRCIVGGADASVSSWSIYGFLKLRNLAKNAEIGHTGVPFSDAHSGFVMAEGAGIIVLESEEHAKDRGTFIYGRLEGAYSNNAGFPLFQADIDGQSMIKAIQGAIGSQLPSYVNSQALGLQENDHIDRIAHHSLFGRNIPITSIKGMTGHAFGSSGAIQIISALISIEDNIIPPTIKTKGEGFEDLPIVKEIIHTKVDSVVITTHGYGGNNTSLFVTRYL